MVNLLTATDNELELYVTTNESSQAHEARLFSAQQEREELGFVVPGDSFAETLEGELVELNFG